MFSRGYQIRARIKIRDFEAQEFASLAARLGSGPKPNGSKGLEPICTRNRYVGLYQYLVRTITIVWRNFGLAHLGSGTLFAASLTKLEDWRAFALRGSRCVPSNPKKHERRSRQLCSFLNVIVFVSRRCREPPCAGPRYKPGESSSLPLHESRPERKLPPPIWSLVLCATPNGIWKYIGLCFFVLLRRFPLYTLIRNV
jgi:hypothetical protein